MCHIILRDNIAVVCSAEVIVHHYTKTSAVGNDVNF